jgi:tRNA A37 threonylcarbamoyladenosine dehydratase
MKKDWLERTELLIQSGSLDKLISSKVLIVGLGGVGSYAAEFLVRAGIGSITIVDGDIVDSTNRNRQLPALSSTIGKSKAEILSQRFLDINPALKLEVIGHFLHPEDMDALVASGYDFVLDCIDSMTPKVHLIIACKRHKTKFISAMGAGGKLNPSKVQISDIYETNNCFFSQEVKRKLKKHGIRWGVKVVFSPEPVSKSALKLTDGTNFKKSFYGTISYMPALFGLYMAYYAIDRLR